MVKKDRVKYVSDISSASQNASNPDIIFTDAQGKLREQQKLSLDNAYI